MIQRRPPGGVLHSRTAEIIRPRREVNCPVRRSQTGAGEAIRTPDPNLGKVGDDTLSTCNHWTQSAVKGSDFTICSDVSVRELCGDPPPETENAAPAGPRNGAALDIEAGQLPSQGSPLWLGAPSIIRLHFCGVAA